MSVPLNRDIRGRRVQILLGPPARRSRGWWPLTGPFPIFHYWTRWRVELRVFTRQRGVGERGRPRR